MNPEPSQNSLLESSTQLWRSARALMRNSAELVGLELRHAGFSLAVIVGLGLVVGLLTASIWFLVLTALIVWLVESNLASWPLTLLLAALANLGLGAVLVIVIKRFTKGLLFEASRRQLFGEDTRDNVPTEMGSLASSTSTL